MHGYRKGMKPWPNYQPMGKAPVPLLGKSISINIDVLIMYSRTRMTCRFEPVKTLHHHWCSAAAQLSQRELEVFQPAFRRGGCLGVSRVSRVSSELRVKLIEHAGLTIPLFLDEEERLYYFVKN